MSTTTTILNAVLLVASPPVDRPKSAGVQVAGLVLEILGLYSIHLLPQLAQAIRGALGAPDFALQLELRLGSLELLLQPLQKLLTIQDASHQRRVHLALAVLSLLGVRRGDVLRISKHEIQLSGLQFVPLEFLAAQPLDICKLGFQRFILSCLEFDDAGLFLDLFLQLLYQTIRSHLHLRFHLIALSNGRFRDLSGLQRFIVRAPRFRVCM
ncbi:hypothetical protein VTN02DRAFT_749 [Thermoascus thermophilus]